MEFLQKYIRIIIVLVKKSFVWCITFYVEFKTRTRHRLMVTLNLFFFLFEPPVLLGPLAAQAGRGAGGARGGGLGDVQVGLLAPRAQVQRGPGRPGTRRRGRNWPHVARETFTARTHADNWSSAAARAIGAATAADAAPARAEKSDLVASTLSIHAERIIIITQFSFCYTLFVSVYC